jgi:hypothetical protein
MVNLLFTRFLAVSRTHVLRATGCLSYVEFNSAPIASLAPLWSDSPGVRPLLKITATAEAEFLKPFAVSCAPPPPPPGGGYSDSDFARFFLNLRSTSGGQEFVVCANVSLTDRDLVLSPGECVSRVT